LLASYPASILNHFSTLLGIPLRFRINPSRSSACPRAWAPTILAPDQDSSVSTIGVAASCHPEHREGSLAISDQGSVASLGMTPFALIADLPKDTHPSRA